MTILTLPGLVDVHTHMRVPGGEHKEDFSTGTAAALAGGFTTLLAMPNTTPPLTTVETLHTTIRRVRSDARCDVGLFAGAGPQYLDSLLSLAPETVALKIYLNDTFGPLRVEDLPTLMGYFQRWPPEKMIAMHAEGQSVAVGIGLCAAFNRPLHFCHISRREEIELISHAKDQGLPVTCEVTPHHLFLTEADAARLGPLADMRPLLGSEEDVAGLWAHINTTIDCIATDHAPHTLAEKHSDSPPPGIAGLETSLPLMLTAVQEGRLSLARLVELMSSNPRRIYRLAPQPDTWVEVEMERYIIKNESMQTKCGWTPFAGRELLGRVHRVVLRGKPVYQEGRLLADPGSGQMITNVNRGN